MSHRYNEYDAHSDLVQWANAVEQHKKAMNSMAVTRFQRKDSKAFRVVCWIIMLSCFATIGMMLAY